MCNKPNFITLNLQLLYNYSFLQANKTAAISIYHILMITEQERGFRLIETIINTKRNICADYFI
jgi:hypothetical protein